MVNSQLFFTFDSKTSLSKTDIVVGSFNKTVVEFLFYNNKWLSEIIYIYGEKGVGKSFVTHIFAKENGGILISLADIKNLTDIEQIVANNNLVLLEDIHQKTLEDEVNLFNLYNTSIAYKTKLIFTSIYSVEDLNIKLPDLASRLSGAIIFRITNPDDISLRAIFFKMLSDKQLNVSLEVMDYILKRSQRDCSTLMRIVQEIDNFTMKEKKTLNLSTVKNIKLDFIGEVF